VISSLRISPGEPELIVRSMLNLAGTGELITKAVRGDGTGIHLYLPNDYGSNLFSHEHPLTWLEEVAKYVDEFWVIRVGQAEADGTKPRPFSTGEFRNYVITKELRFEPSPKGDAQNLVNALKSLSVTRNPLLRRIKRTNEKACLWVPFKVPEDGVQLGDSYASDTERIGMAVQRATKRLGRPVKIQDIKEEIELDASLKPVSTKQLFTIVSDAAKELIDAGRGIRLRRNLRRVYRIGRLHNEAYYDFDNRVGSHSWLRFRQLEAQWLGICAEERISNLADGSAPSIMAGRALLIKNEVMKVADTLNTLVADDNLYQDTLSEARMLCGNVSNMLTQLDIWIAANIPIGTNLPELVDPQSDGMTAHELLKFMKLISPRVKGETSHNKLIIKMKDNIRRLPNPHFSNRFSNNPRNSCDYLYDRTSAFIYTAKHWGGHECCTQAMIAEVELERLRDVRFVLPALDSPNRNIRFAGVACLAFLKATEGNELLRKVITTDNDPGIRRSSLWAYGFAGGIDSEEVFRNSAMYDRNAEVRKFAKYLLDVDELGWWML
jgi:hypothetical protein